MVIFVLPAFGTTGDYHLQNGSLAIDAGTSTAAPHTDLEGRSRPQGDGYDIGAFEFATLTTTAGGPPPTTIIIAGLAALLVVLAVAVYLRRRRKVGP
jgi:MYXO-CTERM domain-containing protein